MEERKKMITSKNPSLVIFSNNLARYRYKQKGKFYVVDNLSNVFEVDEAEYKRLKIPVKKISNNEEEQ